MSEQQISDPVFDKPDSLAGMPKDTIVDPDVGIIFSKLEFNRDPNFENTDEFYRKLRWTAVTPYNHRCGPMNVHYCDVYDFTEKVFAVDTYIEYESTCQTSGHRNGGPVVFKIELISASGISMINRVCARWYRECRPDIQQFRARIPYPHTPIYNIVEKTANINIYMINPGRIHWCR